MKIHYKFIKEQNLLIQRCEGTFTIEEHKRYMHQLMSHDEWRFVDKILNDFRGVDIRLTQQDVAELHKFRTEVVQKPYLNVTLIEKPRQTAMVHFYQASFAPNKTKYERCSTIRHAIKLLNLSIDFNDERILFGNLSHRFSH